MKKSHVVALESAIKFAGSQAALAKAIGEFTKRPTVKQQTVSAWVTSGIYLDPKWCIAIEHITNGEVTREQLRPDFFRLPKTRGANRASA